VAVKKKTGTIQLLSQQVNSRYEIKSGKGKRISVSLNQYIFVPVTRKDVRQKVNIVTDSQLSEKAHKNTQNEPMGTKQLNYNQRNGNPSFIRNRLHLTQNRGIRQKYKQTRRTARQHVEYEREGIRKL
jgi:LPS sulfotransferase NodH